MLPINLEVFMLSNLVDTKDRIARSNIYSIFGKLMKRQIDNNDDGEILLMKAGLSSFWKEYGDKFCPYWYNRGYRNDNDNYNPEYACMVICKRIESDEEALLRFLNLILDGIHNIEEEQFEQLSNYLGVIGYELLLNIEVNEDFDYETKHYSLIPATSGAQQRNADISYLRSMLITHHSDLIVMYNEAIANFGSGQYVSCIENCRSLLENFFKKLDTTNNDYVKGILVYIDFTCCLMRWLSDRRSYREDCLRQSRHDYYRRDGYRRRSRRFLRADLRRSRRPFRCRRCSRTW